MPQYVRPLSPSTLRNIIREEMSYKQGDDVAHCIMNSLVDVMTEKGERSQRQDATLDNVLILIAS